MGIPVCCCQDETVHMRTCLSAGHFHAAVCSRHRSVLFRILCFLLSGQRLLFRTYSPALEGSLFPLSPCAVTGLGELHHLTSFPSGFHLGVDKTNRTADPRVSERLECSCHPTAAGHCPCERCALHPTASIECLSSPASPHSCRDTFLSSPLPLLVSQRLF